MRIVDLTVLSVIYFFLPPVVLADDLPGTVDEDLPVLSPVKNIWLTDQATVTQLQPPFRTSEMFPLGTTRPLFDFNFEDTNTLKQISKLRTLSFLTLADKGQLRFFLGVNADGLAGFHVTLFQRQDDGRILELLRMPYLSDIQTVDSSIHADTKSD